MSLGLSDGQSPSYRRDFLLCEAGDCGSGSNGELMLILSMVESRASIKASRTRMPVLRSWRRLGDGGRILRTCLHGGKFIISCKAELLDASRINCSQDISYGIVFVPRQAFIWCRFPLRHAFGKNRGKNMLFPGFSFHDVRFRARDRLALTDATSL